MFVVIFLLNMLMIMFFGAEDLHNREKRKWRAVLEKRVSPRWSDSAEDLVDRAACLIVWWQSRKLRT